jgi:hypothetical protein
MRDRIKLLVIGIVGLVWIIAMAVMPSTWEVPALLVPGLILLTLFAFIMYSVLLEKNRSPQLCGYGLHTSLLQRDPVARCLYVEPARYENDKEMKCKNVGAHPAQTFTLGLYPHGGCVALAMKGGGPDGYTVVRTDLVRSPGDDGSTVELYGIPVMFRAGGGAGFRDLNDLPPQVQSMLRQHENWSENAPVNYMLKPIKGFDLDGLHKNDTLDFEVQLYEQTNLNNSQAGQVSNLRDATAKLAETHKSTTEGYAKKDPKTWRESLTLEDER